MLDIMTAYFKLSGAGNDFLALVEPASPPDAATIRAWCRRGLSLGADGLFVLTRTARGARMVHYNADGGRSELCLNGSRCAVQLACSLGWGSGDVIVLDTDAGALAGRRLDDRKAVLELPPIVSEPRALDLAVGRDRYSGWRLRVGVPHLVLPWEGELRDAPVAERGPALRSHPDLGEDGANVDFARFAARDRFAIRTFERGVEAETLACGTGVVAAAAVGVAAGRLELPATALTAGGFELSVGGEVAGGCLGRVELGGDARILARGELCPAAGWIPSPPA